MSALSSSDDPASVSLAHLSGDRNDARLMTALFCVVIATVLTGLYGVSRPTETPFLTLLSTWGLSIFLLLFPQGCRALQHRQKRSVSEVGFDSVWLGVGLVGAIAAGWLVPRLGVSLLPLFWIAGMGLLVGCLVQFLGRPQRQPLWVSQIGVGAIALLFSIYHGWLVWGSCCLFTRYEQRLLAGKFHIDPLFHSSFVAMLQTHNIPSTGLDGPVYIAYHYGSHWIFAQLAFLLDLSPFQFYNLAYPILIVPLLFRSLLAFSLDIRAHQTAAEQRWNLRQDWLFWGVLLIGFVGVLPPRFLDLNLIILSESHLVATTLAFLALSLALRLNQVRTGFKIPLHPKPLFLAISLGVLIPWVTLTKVSVGFLLFCAAGYAVLRLGLYRCRWLLPCFGGAIALQIYTLNLMGYFSGNGGAGYEFLLFGYFGRMAASRLPLYLLGVFLWSLLYAAFRIQQSQLGSIQRWKDAIWQGKILDLEIIALLCILGALPGLFLSVPGSVVYYFIDFQMWVSLSLILGNLNRLDSHPSRFSRQEEHSTHDAP